MMRGIKRDPARFFTGRERPMRHDFVFGGIDRRDFAFVFDVDVNAAGRGIDRGKFRARPRAESWRPLSASSRQSRWRICRV